MATECRVQWDLTKYTNKLDQLFKSDVQIRVTTAHNIHEDNTRAQ